MTSTSPFNSSEWQKKSFGPSVKWQQGDTKYHIGLGESIKGILLKIDESTSSKYKKSEDEVQKVYTLRGKDNDEFRIFSRGEAFDALMAEIQIGQWVGFHYADDVEDEEDDSQNAFKLIEVYAGPMQPGFNE